MSSKPSIQWDDPFQFEKQSSEEERLVPDTAREHAQDKLMPRILLANRNETFNRDIMREMCELDLLRTTIPEEYDYAGVDNNIHALILGRAMTGLQTFSVK